MRLGSELERESIPEKGLPWQFVRDERQLARDREDGEAMGTGCANTWGEERAWALLPPRREGLQPELRQRSETTKTFAILVKAP